MSHSWDDNRWSLERTDVLAEVALLRAAADESARHVRMFYFSFLLFAFYVGVIAFSTDDEQLLKGAGARLPLLDVELPLLAFYIVAPLLVLIFHAHLLNQFFLLSRKLFRLDRALRSLPAGPEATQRELPFPLIFSHRIIGTHHPPLIRQAFRAAVAVTLLLLPLILLAILQWKFLPYHGARITFEHRAVFTLDLLLLWLSWPRLSSPSGRWWLWFGYPRRWRLFGEVLRLIRSHRRCLHWRTVGALALTVLPLLGVWLLLVPPGSGLEWFIGYQKWLDGIHRNLVLRERTLMRREPPAALLFAGPVKTDEERARLWQEAGEALDLRGRDLRYADFSGSKLWNADLRGAQLSGADLREAQLPGADLLMAQLPGADLQDAVVYGTEFRNAELSLADLRGLHRSRDGLEQIISELQDQLAWEGEHWSQDGRDRVMQAIDRLWSIAFDLSLNPTRLSPLQGFDVMHNQRGLLATWPAPPDPAEFLSARADYRAELACTDPHIAKGMQRQAKPPDWSEEKPDPVLEQALVERAASGECPVLAELLKENQRDFASDL